MSDRPRPPDWRDANRRNWDERVALHLDAPSYETGSLRAGNARFDAIVEAGLGDVTGKRVLHLQCHFGRDTLILAQRGAEVTGVDFSEAAIAAARALAEGLGLADRAEFILSDVYDAAGTLGRAGSYDMIFVTWGAIYWLPDIEGWARTIAHFLRPGGTLFFAEGHPAAMVFDDDAPPAGPIPGAFIPYFETQALEFDDPQDYASPVKLTQTRTVEWMHPMGAVLTALTQAGLSLDWLEEHDRAAWQMFGCLVEKEPGLYGWPDKSWLPLSYSLTASRR